MSSKKSLSAMVGKPPVGDSLGVASWMVVALGAMASQVLDDKQLKQDEKREQLLRIADRIVKLKDLDRIHQVEQLLRNTDAAMTETARGPQLADAPNLNEQARPVAARRGRPPRSAIR